MESYRIIYVLILAVFVIAGRKFLDAWRNETPAGARQRWLYGGACFACFLVVAFFEVRL